MNSKFKKLIDKINVYPTSSEAIESIIDKLSNEKVIVAFANAHAFNLANKYSSFFHDLVSSNFLLRDGIGVKLYFKMLNRNPGYNLNGTDFIPQLLMSISQDKNIAIFGTEDSIINSSIDAIENLGAKVVLTANGFHDVDYYLEISKGTKIDIYLLAMGMPKQEHLAKKLYNDIDDGIIICGGAIIDFLGGKVKRAPIFFRRFGIEWVYRLFCEPKRMFRRYIIGNFMFLWLAFLSVIKNDE